MTPASGTTDANGIASSSWTLGSVSGGQTAQATVSGAGGSPVTFTATALADAAEALLKADGDGQTGDINTQLAEPVQARVTDQFGNGVEGTSVSWSGTGATVSAASALSNAAGISQVSVTLGGSAGPVTITAAAEGLTGSPLSFSATAVTPAPAPSSINVTVGNILFRSNRNSTQNPAVDTIAVNGTVTWTWVNTGQTSHNVDSDGSPAFTSSSVLSGNGQTYSFQFTATGTYQYTCAIHPGQMTGRIVVR
jgi:plastocyanin